MRTILFQLMVLVFCIPVQAQWIPTSGPDSGGTVRSLLVNGNFLFCGNNNGVYRTSDSGNSWTHLTNGFPGGVVGTPALSVQGNNIFAGTEINGINLSTDNGNSWTNINAGISEPYSFAIATCGNKLFSSTFGSGVFVSIDTGASWVHINTIGGPVIQCFLVNGNTMYAGTEDDGVLKSDDCGVTWNNSSTGLPANSKVQALAKMGSLLFAGTNGDGVFLSNDDGASWSPVNNGLTHFYIRCLAVSGNGLFAGHTQGVFLTTDSGASWSAINDGLVTPQNRYITTLAVDSTHVFAGTVAAGGGVWKRELAEVISVGEISNDQLPLKLFPVPAHKSVTIIPGRTMRDAMVTVFNSAGDRLITKQALSFPSQINIEKLAPGFYFVELDGGRERVYGKLLIE